MRREASCPSSSASCPSATASTGSSSPSSARRRRAYWTRNVWEKPLLIEFASVGEAAKALQVHPAQLGLPALPPPPAGRPDRGEAARPCPPSPRPSPSFRPTSRWAPSPSSTRTRCSRARLLESLSQRRVRIRGGQGRAAQPGLPQALGGPGPRGENALAGREVRRRGRLAGGLDLGPRRPRGGGPGDRPRRARAAHRRPPQCAVPAPRRLHAQARRYRGRSTGCAPT